MEKFKNLDQNKLLQIKGSSIGTGTVITSFFLVGFISGIGFEKLLQKAIALKKQRDLVKKITHEQLKNFRHVSFNDFLSKE